MLKVKKTKQQQPILKTIQPIEEKKEEIKKVKYFQKK